jgi:hypothetical protein
MTFQTVNLNDLPKREPKGFNAAAANALLAAATAAPDSGASDGTAYPDEAEARKIAGRHKRLLEHVIPSDQVVKTRVFPSKSGGFGWTVFVAAAPAEPSAKKGAK